MAKKQDNPIDSALVQVKEVLKDPTNKNAIAASTVAYMLGGEHKERNALVAGVLAYMFLSNEEDEE